MNTQDQAAAVRLIDSGIMLGRIDGTVVDPDWNFTQKMQHKHLTVNWHNLGEHLTQEERDVFAELRQTYWQLRRLSDDLIAVPGQDSYNSELVRARLQTALWELSNVYDYQVRNLCVVKSRGQ